MLNELLLVCLWCKKRQAPQDLVGRLTEKRNNSGPCSPFSCVVPGGDNVGSKGVCNGALKAA